MISRILSLDILSPDLSTCFAASADIFRLLFLVLFVGVVDPLDKRHKYRLLHQNISFLIRAKPSGLL